ncbi:MAG: ATP-binding protein [Candidatus Paceibacterota bacterium]
MYIKRFADKKIAATLNKSKKVLLILGARQVGKTTSINNFLSDKNTVYLNFDVTVDKSRFLAASTLSPTEAFKYLGAPDYLIIDEAQREISTGKIVKGWYDSQLPMRIVLLGSSSLDLLNQSAESLTGRNEKIILPPLLFEEIIRNQNWFDKNFTNELLLKNFSAQIKTILMQSLVFGNYPEIVLAQNKNTQLLNLANDYLFKDVLQLGLLKSPEQINRLLTLLAHQIGSEISVNELANTLDISRITVEKYLDILEQTFVIFQLKSFSTNPRKEIAKGKKIYFYDTGIRNALLKEFSLDEMRSDIDALWENWAIAEFMKKNLLTDQLDSLYFWRTRSQSEVDLVVKGQNKLAAYEIKWNKIAKPIRAFEEQYKTPTQTVTSTNPFVGPILDF